MKTLSKVTFVLVACLFAWVVGCSSDNQAAVSCANGELVCGPNCVEAASDSQNCGACGNACTAGQVCSAGVCGLTCSGGSTACGGSCVAVSVDPRNCGGCGNVCLAGQICSAGVCSAQCPAQQTLCIGDGGAVSCVTTRHDGANCGACGVACTAGKVCSAGACSDTCGAGEALCPGAMPYCAATQSDNANCGSCGKACPSGESCAAGTCANGCGTAETLCSGGDGGAAYCAVTASDQANCGACGNACASPKKCVSGTCQIECGAGLSICGTECVNLKSDRDNCNVCGTKCSGLTPYCVAGKCAKQNILEDFENTTWIRSPWVANGGSTASTEIAACAHDGVYGLQGDSGWIYRTDVSIGASGDQLSAWAMNTGGRDYFGFGSTSTDTYSIVLAQNTGALIIQQNTGYTGYVDLATTSYTYTAGAWYRLAITFGAGGLVNGALFDAGNVKVATVSWTISGFVAGGVAFRGFGSVECIDTMTD